MRRALPLLLFVLLLPVSVSAAESTFFGPIVPPECNCEGIPTPGGETFASAANWGCVLQTVQNGMNFAVSISIIILLVMIVIAGITFMTSAANPSAREAGRRRVANAFIGMLVVLGAWLFVDFVMKILYNPDVDVAGDSFGPWNEILTDAATPLCFLVADAPPPLPGVTANPGNWNNSEYEALARGTGTGACNPALVQHGAAMGGFRITNAQANTLACIARYESTCGTRNLNYNWNRGSSAAGPFQVLLSGNAQAYENPACYQAVGVTGPLNCAAGFRNGNPIPGSQIAARCVRAAVNLNCSASAAAYILARQGFGAWTTDPNSAMQRECINRGGR